MSEQRIYGKHVQIKLNDALIGEIDAFSARKLDQNRTHRPIGFTLERPNVIHGGWELTFKGGKTNAQLSRVIQAQEMSMHTLGYYPTFEVFETIFHYSGAQESYVYKKVVLFNGGRDINGANEEISESITGFATHRETNNIVELTSDMTKLAENVLNQLLSDNTDDAAVKVLTGGASLFGNEIGS